MISEILPKVSRIYDGEYTELVATKFTIFGTSFYKLEKDQWLSEI